MSWGTELWDQLDSLIDLAHKNIEFCERYNDFLKERCKAEQTYAKELRKMAKNHQLKKKDDEEVSTCSLGYNGVLKEVCDMAGQHETIAENMLSTVIKPLQGLIAELKTERKKSQDEGKRLQSQLDGHHQLLQKAKRRYEAAFRDSEKAHELFLRAEADNQLSRAEVDRYRLMAAQRAQACCDAKAEYASVLQTTNEYQRQHYGQLLPQLIEQVQRLEEKRINNIKSLIKDSSRLESDVQPIVTLCLTGINGASDQINVTTDIQQVIDKLKSGHAPPGDLPFEDLGAEDGSSAAVSHGGSTGSLRSSSGEIGSTPKKADSGFLSARDKKKDRGGIRGIFGKPKPEEPREDYGHLPPQQQKKQLSKKITEISAQLAKETKEREALVKMASVYAQTPSLGDPKTIEKQLEEKTLKIDMIAVEMHKFEQYLAQAEGSTASLEDAKSPYKKNDTANSPALQSAQVCKSPGSNGGATEHAYDSFEDDDNDDPPTGKEICKALALYAFQPTNDGSVGLDSNETVSVLEHDQGDGWTRVCKANGQRGFVPTSYIQLTN